MCVCPLAFGYFTVKSMLESCRVNGKHGNIRKHRSHYGAVGINLTSTLPRFCYLAEYHLALKVL